MNPVSVFYSKVDGYGFQRGENFNHQQYDEFMSTYLSVMTRRAMKWNRLIGGRAKISKSPQGIQSKCADPEGGGGPDPHPLENHKNIGFLSNTGPDPM